MKNYKQYIIPGLMALLLAGWAGRSHIRNLFPPRMKFANAALITADDNRTITIDDYKGSVVIVSCFQTWCVDCARETPGLNQLADTIHSPVFKVVYVTDEDSARVAAFRTRFSSGHILFTYSAASMQELGITAFPTTFLLNKKGKVVLTKLEGYDWMQQAETIRALIAEQ